MKIEQLEHLIRAAAEITGDEIVVIGSQAILGEIHDAPEALLESMEADLFPRYQPARAIEIDGVLGDGSSFHEQFGYYAHGIGPETPVPPAGWESRLKRVVFAPNKRWKEPAIAWFLHPDDLVLAKLAAGRERDVSYAEAAIREGLVDIDNLQRGVKLIPETHRTTARTSLERAIAAARRPPRG